MCDSINTCIFLINFGLFRKAAINAGVPIVPGTDGPVSDKESAVNFCKTHGLPVIFKAAYGGGGRGMRVVRKMDEVEELFDRLNIVN